MAISWILIGLQASGRVDGVSSTDFLEPLDIQAGEVEDAQAIGGPWRSAMVVFATIRDSDFSKVDTSIDGGAQALAFEESIQNAFRTAARFLNQRSTTITSAMKASGLSLRLFIKIQMDQDQMQLDFPTDLLAACSRHGFGVHLISNDC